MKGHEATAQAAEEADAGGTALSTGVSAPQHKPHSFC